MTQLSSSEEERVNKAMAEAHDELTDFMVLTKVNLDVLKSTESPETMEQFIEDYGKELLEENVIFNLTKDLKAKSLSGMSLISTLTGLFRSSFGLKFYDELDLTNEKQVEDIKRDAGLIKEELDEFMEAFQKKDHMEMMDAIGDLNVVLRQLMFSCGLSPQMINLIDLEVSNSNQSKLFKTVDDVLEAKLQQEKEGVDCFVTQVQEGVFSLRRSSDNKVLKNKKEFKKPNFEFLKRITNFK